MSGKRGKLYIVGIGPGGPEHLTPAARQAIEEAEVVAGYQLYLDLVAPLLPGKEIIASGMRQEVERCRQALAAAASGRTVALISSGDPGIYGMAGLAMELAETSATENDHPGPVGANPAGVPAGTGAVGAIPVGAVHESPPRNTPRQDLAIEIVPGVSAVQAAAARLGAPLMHDFAVVSLSDLLTPWEAIRRRLEAAAAADFVVALYNPRSHGRTTQLGEARQILLRHRAPTTPVGIVRNAGRSGEQVIVTDLAAFPEDAVDMLSLVIVGNSQTRIDGAGRMVTPRGYEGRIQESGVRSQEKDQKLATWNLEPAPARALFVGGTGSDVGKSVITAGLCRLLARRGISVAPFKAQNMALNSAVTPEGGEIGRAQALQAAACGIPPHTDMNPVLLKPNSETGSQVIVQGRAVGNMSVREYHAFKDQVWERIRESFARLAARHQVVIMEGAGSIAEINLRRHDVCNLRAARMAGAPVVLVADIDRGGVFAAIVGTLELLTPAERRQVAGVIINKFRGDPELLRPGIEEVERRTGVPVLGVVPWLELRLPEEDSLGLRRRQAAQGDGPLRIGVVRLPRLANYTDFDAFTDEGDVSLAYLQDPAEVEGLDLLILPGTKNTLADLEYLRQSGFARAIRDHHARGGRIVGICGGYQLLGCRIADPLALESARGEAEGLGLLEVETVMQPVKETHLVRAEALPVAQDAGFAPGAVVEGYEIHLGHTRLGPQARPLFRILSRGDSPTTLEDGAVSCDGRVWGTYLHGLFDDPAARRAVLDRLRAERGLPLNPPGRPSPLAAELDRLADHLQRHLELERLWSRLDLPLREVV